MAKKAVYDALKAKVAADWTAPPPIYFPDELYSPPDDGSAFILVQFPVSTVRTVTLGAPGQNIIREAGGIRFVLNSELGAGITDVLSWADALSNMLTNKVFDGVRTFEVGSPSTENDNDQGTYFQSWAVVEYEYDFLC